MPKWHLHWLLAMEEMILYESVADCTTTSAIAVQRFVERMESQWGLKSSHATTTVRKRKTTTKNNNQKLRYKKPNVEEVVKENLQRMTSSEVYTLFHELPQEHPWFNDVMDALLALEASMEEDDE